MPIQCKTINFANITHVSNGRLYPAEWVVVLRQSFPSAVASFGFQKCTCFMLTHLYTLVLRASCAPKVRSIHVSVHLRRCVFQLCDDFRYPSARPPEMRISSIDVNDSHLRACLDVARCSRAMISNVSLTCRVHGAQS